MLLSLQLYLLFFYSFDIKQLRTFFSEKLLKKVLDVGTGTGDFVSALKNVFPKAKIIGIETKVKMIYPFNASAPLTISSISLVIVACRALLY